MRVSMLPIPATFPRLFLLGFLDTLKAVLVTFFRWVMTRYPSKTFNRLWIARIKRGMGRKKLARLLGHTTTSQLSRWEVETQLPSLPNALLLGYLLQTPIEFLFKDLREELIRQVQSGHASEDDQALREHMRPHHAR